MSKPHAAVRALALGLALTAVALPLRAEPERFDFTISGFRVGALTFAFDQSGASYSATARIDAAGILSMFADIFYDGRTTGHLAPHGTVVPEHFIATSKSPRALRHTRIDWQDGTPVSVSVEPPRSTAPDPSAQGGTLDPVSAGFRLFRAAPPDQICDTTVLMFDGSRLSRLVVAPPVQGDDGIACAGTFARVEGEAHDLAEQREFPFRMLFRVNGEGLARLERIEAPTSFGTAVMSRRS